MLQKFNPKNSDIQVYVGGHLLHRNEAKVSVFDSVVQGGDAVWEGLRVYKQGIFCLDRHLNRLIEAYTTIEDANPEGRLLSDLLLRLLDSNRLAAERLADIKALRGILPICMHCKKIYDSDEKWTAMETYIENHSHAQFTHGLCPVCAVKHYGDYFDEEQPPQPS